MILTTLAEEMVSCPSLLSELQELLETKQEKTGSVAWTRTGKLVGNCKLSIILLL